MQLEVGCKVRWKSLSDDGWYPTQMIDDGHPNVFTIEKIAYHNDDVISYITLAEVTEKHGKGSHSYGANQVERII
jgi:hypothetical protein